MPNGSSASADLRGATHLTIDAIGGITNLVEAMHHTICSFGRPPGVSGRPVTGGGTTAMVYRSIRGIAGLVGGGLDVLLQKLGAGLEDKGSSRRREALLAALNGVLGDHLEARGNPLAIPMQLRRNGKPLSGRELSEVLRQSSGGLAILAHGTCMNDLQWDRQGHDHGAALARDLGLQPLYLHYNSGLHVSENGEKLSHLLEELVGQTIAQSARPPELVIIGHSMGGLVARSACSFGAASGQRWLPQLRKLIFLGTPHHGSLLERGGNWIDVLLQISRYSAPFARLGKIRSAGVTDLRHGNVAAQDWQGRDRFEPSGDLRVPTPLPDNVQCYAIAATLDQTPGPIGDRVVGDGLVTVRSALGVHDDPRLNLSIPEERQWVARGISHMDLLSHPEVYETLRRWVRD